MQYSIQSNQHLIFKFQLMIQIILLSFVFYLLPATPTISSFKQLAQYHCSSFPIETLFRIATGSLSQKFGEQFFQYDCYVRKFIREDGTNYQNDQEHILEVDPLVVEYGQGLSQCLPSNFDQVKAVYGIWRFYRFVMQHDYAYEWIRGKIRAGIGHEAEKPSAWMDGEMKASNLRLEKYFPNQFYEYLDKLMFKDFLHPIMTFLRKNTVIAMNGELTQSGKPLLLQSIETHSYVEEVFKPIIMVQQEKNQIFSYTIPGIPLLFAGSNTKIAWAFTGVLLDRTNVEEIQTVGNRFYDHESEEWIKLKNESITIAGADGKVCSFVHSPLGTLYNKHNTTGKASEYIVKWHENQNKNRLLFSDLHRLILAEGFMDDEMQFPFNSIVFVNETGIFQYLCPQVYPSYFLYPTMFDRPDPIQNRWVPVINKYLVLSNTILTTMKQQTYRKGETLTKAEEQIVKGILSQKEKFSLQKAMDFLKKGIVNPQIKKQKQIMLSIYRRVKFTYFKDQKVRKECDKLISQLQKWNNRIDSEHYSPIFILWNHFTRDYCFSDISVSKFGNNIIRHWLLSETYWTGEMGLWAKNYAMGECNTKQYKQIEGEVNGTGHNTTCFFNVMRAINKTREIIFSKYEKISDLKLSDFTEKRVVELVGQAKGSAVDEAFSIYFSRSLLFGGEIGNKRIVYHWGYRQIESWIELDRKGQDLNDL